MTMPNAPRTARERVRAELTREIRAVARRQLTAVGADGLSMRAVAKELGMVSSALYRYYPSRDDLLTALIIDAYDALGGQAERAIDGARPDPVTGAGGARAQWLAACSAIRAWAVAHPQEYALIYGSPVPGYRAPQATIAPAARVPIALVGVLAGAIAHGELMTDPAQSAAPGEAAGSGETAGPRETAGPGEAAGPGRVRLSGPLADQAAALSAALTTGAASGALVPLAPAVPPDVLVRALVAWTQLFGMISFELFGQFVGAFEPADALFGYAVAQLAAFVGFA